jgi:hypothetical protein
VIDIDRCERLPDGEERLDLAARARLASAAVAWSALVGLVRDGVRAV